MNCRPARGMFILDLILNYFNLLINLDQCRPEAHQMKKKTMVTSLRCTKKQATKATSTRYYQVSLKKYWLTIEH